MRLVENQLSTNVMLLVWLNLFKNNTEFPLESAVQRRSLPTVNQKCGTFCFCVGGHALSLQTDVANRLFTAVQFWWQT